MTQPLFQVERGGAGGGIEEGRVSKISWVTEQLEEDPGHVVRRLNRRLEDATELSLRDAESLQVHSRPHLGSGRCGQTILLFVKLIMKLSVSPRINLGSCNHVTT